MMRQVRYLSNRQMGVRHRIRSRKSVTPTPQYPLIGGYRGWRGDRHTGDARTYARISIQIIHREL